MAADEEAAIRRLFMAWNTDRGVESAWLNFIGKRKFFTAYTADWANRLASIPDMATTLVNFCAHKV
jgi:hypothetical protein